MNQKFVDDILPGIAVAIFNKEKDKVLLQKRADLGLWGLISGHAEPYETVTETAIREVWEEDYKTHWGVFCAGLSNNGIS